MLALRTTDEATSWQTFVRPDPWLRVDVSLAFQFKGHFFQNGVHDGRRFMVIFGNSVDLIPFGLAQFPFRLLPCNFGQYLTFLAQEAFW